MLMTIDVVMGKWKRKFPLGLSYLMSPGSRDSICTPLGGWSTRLPEMYDTKPRVSIMTAAVIRNVAISHHYQRPRLCAIGRCEPHHTTMMEAAPHYEAAPT